MSRARGIVAALRSASVVRGPALDALLAPPTPGIAARLAVRRGAVDARRATRAAFVTLRVLHQLPWWRNTCLYRAVTECLILRTLGLPATLRLGVARSDTGSPSAAHPAVAAHAWVDCPGYPCRSTNGDEASVYAAFRRTAQPVTLGAASR